MEPAFAGSMVFLLCSGTYTSCTGYFFDLPDFFRTLFQNLVKPSKENRHRNHCGYDITDRLSQEHRKHLVLKEQRQNENQRNQKNQL